MITIIVMLILVAVTINVALNGGLFSRAKEATVKTEIQQIKEQIMLKKAEQAADNEINGTTGYNITLDNLGISTELKNKYANKLLISRDGTLHYNADNCTDEEKTIFASLGITPGTSTNTSNYEFDAKCVGEMFEYFDVAKIIIEDDEYRFYVEVEYGNDILKLNMNSGTCTVTNETEDYITVRATTTKEFDDHEMQEVDVPVEDQETMDLVIYFIKENGQIVNNVLIIEEEGIIASTNGTTGIVAPDAGLIGDYTNQNNDVINISLSQDQTKGILTIPGNTSTVYDVYKIEGRDLLIIVDSSSCEIERGENTTTIVFWGEEYTKVNS